MSQKQLEKLVIKLEAETAKLKSDLARAKSQNRRYVKDSKRDLASLKAAFATVGAGLAARSVIRATVQQERAVKQLEQAIRSTGKAAGFSLSELTKYAGELQNATTFGDETIIKGMSQLATFTNITRDQFKRTTVAALDLSARMDQDLKTSVLALGKALNDPVANLGALSRSGIQFSSEQKELVKSLWETGRQADAQRVILAELDRQFGGSAKAARDTLGGAIESLKNAFGDLLENEGGINSTKDSLEELTAILQDPAVKQGVETFTTAVISSFGRAISMVSSLSSGIKWLAEEFAAFVGGPAVGDIPRLIYAIGEAEAELADLQKQNGKAHFGDQSKRIAQLKVELAMLRQRLELSRSNTVIHITDGIEPPQSTGSGQGDTGSEEQKKSYSFIQDPESLNKYKTLLDEYAVVSEHYSAYIEDAFVGAFANIANSMSSTLANAIVEGESLSDALAQVGKSLAKDIVGGLIKIGTQMAINALFASKMQKVIGAETVALAGATASAWAPAAAFSSLATLGSNAIPAQAGITSTVGLANTLALTGMAHDGISEVPSEGTWLLDKGERVLSARQNRDLTQFMQSRAANDDMYVRHESREVHVHIGGPIGVNEAREMLERLNEEAGERMNIRAVLV